MGWVFSDILLAWIKLIDILSGHFVLFFAGESGTKEIKRFFKGVMVLAQ
jgi:hypothetical protein